MRLLLNCLGLCLQKTKGFILTWRLVVLLVMCRVIGDGWIWKASNVLIHDNSLKHLRQWEAVGGYGGKFFQLKKTRLMLWVSNYPPIEEPPLQTSVVGVENC